MNLSTSTASELRPNAQSATLTQSRLKTAYKDVLEGVRLHELWLFLGWRDTKKHYSRSILGPFWMTLSMGVMVVGLGILYSTIFQMDVADYLPFLAIGFIMWGLIGNAITAACHVFSGAAGSLRQIRLPYSIYVFQFVWTQLIAFGHNFIIYLLVALFFGIWPGMNALLFIPALVILTLNAGFAAMILGPLCARFRDVPMIVASVIQVSFFMTPIIWSAEQLPERAFFVNANPFYHLIEIARQPLLGGTAAPINWLAAGAITVVLGIIAFLFFARYRTRIAYWA